jgi:hypothetical protein
MEAERVVSALIEAGSRKARSGPLIQELPPPGEQPRYPEVPPSSNTALAASVTAPTMKGEEGPSLLEQMIAEQATARTVKQKALDRERAADRGLGGFKKGFLGAGERKAEKKVAAVKAVVTTLRPSVGGDDGGQLGGLNADVQRGLEEGGQIASLRKGEWVTPDMMRQIASNPVLSAGFGDPECLAALEALQHKRGASAVEGSQRVQRFTAEFARVMGAHFEHLAGQEGQSPPAVVRDVKELGPLHKQTLERQQQLVKQEVAEVKRGDATVADAAVARVLEDRELCELLLDPRLQQVLLDCGNPALFAQHMRDPDISRKIHRLHAAGLVGTEMGPRGADDG